VKNEKARDSIRKKDARITTTLSQVDSDLGAVLAKQGVRAATHVTAVSSLRQRQDEIRKQLRSNPLGVLGSAATLVTDAEGLQREVLRSLELQTSTLPALELRIAHVRETAAARRQSVVAYAFPGTTTPDGLAPLFQLQAEGGNPDTEVASALASIASARACLVDGQIDQAQGHFDAASTYVANAGAIVESTLAAKTGVETIVATIQEARKQLLRDCQSGVQPLQQLRSEFAPVNFEDVANNIDKGKKAAQGVDAVIAEAAAQYFKQDFLAAKARLDNLLHQLNAAKTGVSGISLKLKELTEKRATLLSKVADTGKTLETVSAKFQHNLSHASSRTKQGYETLQEQQRRLSQVSADGSSINWIAMYLLWESFNSGAHTVSLHIDSDRSSYESSQRASQASQSYAATQTYSIDTSSTSSFGGSGGGNY
jgi:DNA repair exonuclease SbcCD ATPase subunit